MRALVLTLAVSAAALAQGQGDEQPELDLTQLPFSADTVKLVMERAQPKIQQCYEEVLAEMKKPVEGKIRTSFVVTPEGLVKQAKVLKKGTTVRNAKLNDCVVAVLTTLTFPKPKDGKNHPIEFPFNLKAIR